MPLLRSLRGPWGSFVLGVSLKHPGITLTFSNPTNKVVLPWAFWAEFLCFLSSCFFDLYSLLLRISFSGGFSGENDFPGSLGMSQRPEWLVIFLDYYHFNCSCSILFWWIISDIWSLCFSKNHSFLACCFMNLPSMFVNFSWCFTNFPKKICHRTPDDNIISLPPVEFRYLRRFNAWRAFKMNL